MRLISLRVIDESFVIQFTDHEVVLARMWQHCSAFHFQNSSVLSWRNKEQLSPTQHRRILKMKLPAMLPHSRKHNHWIRQFDDINVVIKFTTAEVDLLS